MTDYCRSVFSLVRGRFSPSGTNVLFSLFFFFVLIFKPALPGAARRALRFVHRVSRRFSVFRGRSSTTTVHRNTPAADPPFSCPDKTQRRKRTTNGFGAAAVRRCAIRIALPRTARKKKTYLISPFDLTPYYFYATYLRAIRFDD